MIVLLFGIEHYDLKSKHRLYNIHTLYSVIYICVYNTNLEEKQEKRLALC